MYYVGDIATGTILYAYSLIRSIVTINPRITTDSSGRAIIMYSSENCKLISTHNCLDKLVFFLHNPVGNVGVDIRMISGLSATQDLPARL